MPSATGFLASRRALRSLYGLNSARCAFCRAISASSFATWSSRSFSLRSNTRYTPAIRISTKAPTTSRIPITPRRSLSAGRPRSSAGRRFIRLILPPWRDQTRLRVQAPSLSTGRRRCWNGWLRASLRGFRGLSARPTVPRDTRRGWLPKSLLRDKDPGDLAGCFLGAVVFDGSLHLVGEGLRGSFEPASHVVEERRIEITFITFWFLGLVLLRTQPDPRIERQPLGFILRKVSELDYSGHEIDQADGHKAGKDGIAAIGHHEIGDLRPDVEEEYGSFIAEKWIGEGGARQRERLDIHAGRPQAAGPDRRGVT